jgi:hypothetical protein
MTVDRVLVQIDTDRSAQLVNRQQFYVSMSRARIDVQVFTNSVERLPAVVSRELVKTIAREAVQGQQRKRERARKTEDAPYYGTETGTINSDTTPNRMATRTPQSTTATSGTHGTGRGVAPVMRQMPHRPDGIGQTPARGNCRSYNLI